MNKFLHKILVILVLSIAVLPAMANEDTNNHQQIEQETQAISITYEGSTIYIKNAEGFEVTVYDITGKIVTNKVRITSQSYTLEIASQPKGYYIIKVGNVSRKVYKN